MQRIINIILLVFISISLCSCTENESANQSVSELESMETITNMYKNEIKVLINGQLPNSIIDANSNIKNINGDTLKFADVIVSTKILYRITNRHCDKCIRKQLEYLNDVAKKTDPSFIVVLCGCSSLNELKSLQERYDIKFPLYQINDSSFLVKHVEEMNMPYVFVINTNMTTSLLYVPIDGNDNLNKYYYTHLEDYVNRYIKSESEKIERKLSKVHFISTSIRKADIQLNSTSLFKFALRNIGANPLVIKYVKPECGCTIANWKKLPIQPNDTSSIIIEYKAESEGDFSKSVLVFSNSDCSPTKLQLLGNVVADLH